MKSDDALKLGISHHQAGRLSEAEKIYRQILAAQPNHPDALNLLGLLAGQAGRPDIAIKLIGRAVQLHPAAAPFHNNLGTALLESGRIDEAISTFRRAVELQPGLVPAHNNLGNALSQKFDYTEAAEAYRRAIALKPDLAEAHSNLGNVLREQGLFAESVAACQTAIRLKPTWAESYSNLGNALRDQGFPEPALAAYKQAIAIQPAFAIAYNNMGTTLRSVGKLQEGIAAHRRALELNPNYPDAHFNLALSLLLVGDFEEGLEEHEWLWKKPGASLRDFSQPRWQGEDLAGKTILVHGEYGLGDTIQFVRYAPLIAARGARVIVECQPTLHRLFLTLEGPQQVIARGQPLPNFDLHCPIMGLPRAMETRLDSIPTNVPYLFADTGQSHHWKSKLDANQPGLKVGLVWAGNTIHKNDRNRSIPFDQISTLLQLEGVRFFSLQKEVKSADAAAVRGATQLMDYTSDLHDMADTAALVSQLDLVIAVDTAVAHLAGAMGKPVWMLITYDPDWRWLLNRQDSPWYPTLRLFRQKTAGDWNDVIQRVASALRAQM